MERSTPFYETRALATTVILILIFIVSFLAGPLWYFVFILLLFVFIAAGIRRIPAEPHARGIVTWLGRKTSSTVGDGYVFLPLQPILFDLITVEITNKLIEIEPKGMRTPDDEVEVYMKIAIMWNPDPEYLAEYLDRGGEEIVKKTIEDISEAAIRKLISDPHNNPTKWKDAMEDNTLFVEAIIESLFEAKNDSEIRNAAEDIGRGFNKYRIPYLGVLINRIDVTLSPPPKDKAPEPSPIIV